MSSSVVIIIIIMYLLGCLLICTLLYFVVVVDVIIKINFINNHTRVCHTYAQVNYDNSHLVGVS